MTLDKTRDHPLLGLDIGRVWSGSSPNDPIRTNPPIHIGDPISFGGSLGLSDSRLGIVSNWVVVRWAIIEPDQFFGPFVFFISFVNFWPRFWCFLFSEYTLPSISNNPSSSTTSYLLQISDLHSFTTPLVPFLFFKFCKCIERTHPFPPPPWPFLNNFDSPLLFFYRRVSVMTAAQQRDLAVRPECSCFVPHQSGSGAAVGFRPRPLPLRCLADLVRTSLQRLSEQLVQLMTTTSSLLTPMLSLQIWKV